MSRFRNHFASWTGTAPIDASSGTQIRHWLSRAGNRRMNHVLYIAAIVQIRHNTPGRAYYQRKLAEGKTPLEALRCLRRRLSDVVYRQLLTDATAAGAGDGAGPGGHSGATLSSSAAGPTPTADSSDKPLPEPAATTLPNTRSPCPTPSGLGTGHHAPTFGRRQLGAPHRTNEVDADQTSAHHLAAETGH